MKKLITLLLLTSTLALNAMEQTSEITLTNKDPNTRITIPRAAALQSKTIEKMLSGSTINLPQINTSTLQLVTDLMKEQDQRTQDTQLEDPKKQMPQELFGILLKRLPNVKPKQIAQCIKALHFLDNKPLFDAVASYFVQEVIAKKEHVKLLIQDILQQNKVHRETKDIQEQEIFDLWLTEKIVPILKKEYKRQRENQLGTIFNQKTPLIAHLRSIIFLNCLSDQMKEILYRLPPGNKDYETVFSSVFNATPSSDRRYLATVSKNSIAQVWKMSNLRNPIASFDNITAIGFSPNNHYIATANNWTAQVWNMSNLKNPIASFDNIDWIFFSPNSSYVATVLNDHTAQIWDINALKNPIASFDNIDWICFSPNSSYVVTVLNDHTTKIWDMNNLKKPITSIHGFFTFCFSDSYVTLSKDNSSQICYMNNLKNPIISFDNIQDVCFSFNSCYLATLSNYTVQIWNMSNLKNPIASFDNINLICFSTNNRYLASVLKDHTAQVWDISDLKNPIASFDGIYAIEFSPNNHRVIILSSNDDTFKIYNLTNPKDPISIINHLSSEVAFLPDGNSIISYGVYYENKVRIWNYQQWYNTITQEISTLNPEQLKLLQELDQLIQQGTLVAPLSTFEVAKTLPRLIRNNIDQHIKLPTKATVMPCTIL